MNATGADAQAESLYGTWRLLSNTRELVATGERVTYSARLPRASSPMVAMVECPRLSSEKSSEAPGLGEAHGPRTSRVVQDHGGIRRDVHGGRHTSVAPRGCIVERELDRLRPGPQLSARGAPVNHHWRPPDWARRQRGHRGLDVGESGLVCSGRFGRGDQGASPRDHKQGTKHPPPYRRLGSRRLPHTERCAILPSQLRRQAVSDPLYAGAAVGYDLFARATSLFIPSLFRAAHLTPGQHVLDVATGTGIVAQAAAEIVGQLRLGDGRRHSPSTSRRQDQAERTAHRPATL